MKTKILLITLSAISIVLSGCGLVSESIEITYRQQQGISSIPGANNITVSVKVNDQRQQKDKATVSHKKHASGLELAPITSREDVTITIQKAIEQELSARGFQPSTKSALVQISADLTRFYNDIKIRLIGAIAVADLIMSVVVKSEKDEVLYSKEIVAQGIDSSMQFSDANFAKLALNRALENGMKLLFEDQKFISALMAVSK